LLGVHDGRAKALETSADVPTLELTTPVARPTRSSTPGRPTCGATRTWRDRSSRHSPS
jgi:hypothetical protein